MKKEMLSTVSVVALTFAFYVGQGTWNKSIAEDPTAEPKSTMMAETAPADDEAAVDESALDSTDEEDVTEEPTPTVEEEATVTEEPTVEEEATVAEEPAAEEEATVAEEPAVEAEPAVEEPAAAAEMMQDTGFNAMPPSTKCPKLQDGFEVAGKVKVYQAGTQVLQITGNSDNNNTTTSFEEADHINAMDAQWAGMQVEGGVDLETLKGKYVVEAGNHACAYKVLSSGKIQYYLVKLKEMM